MTMRLQNKKKRQKNKILVLGGAGLIGSEISSILIKKNYEVIIIDNLDPLCFGSYNRVKKLKKIKFFKKDILKINIKKYLIWSDIIINCIGWTRHNLARNNRSFNKKANFKTVDIILENLKTLKNKKVLIHFSTLSQFNNCKMRLINDKTSFNSSDAIGLIKSKAEKLIIKMSRRYKLNTVCIRLGNCFSDELQIKKYDPGLLATLVNDLIIKKEATVYGKMRKRNFAYIPDVAKFVELLIKKDIKGYVPVNFIGRMITIENLLKKIIKKINFGKIKFKKMPMRIKKIDSSYTKIESKNFYKYSKKIQTPIDKCLTNVLKKLMIKET